MIKEKEYLFSVDKLKRPKAWIKDRSIGLLLTRLIIMEPGSNPLHPEMGVGIKSFRYTVDTLGQLRTRIEEQINTYLPCFPSSNVEISINDDHTCNVEITIDDTIYVYDSNEAPVPITLDNVR